MSSDDKVLDDKALYDRDVRCFANDDYLKDFVKSVLVRDKKIRYSSYAGYISARRIPSLMVKLAKAMILDGADTDDIKKAMNKIDPKLAVGL